MLPYNRTAAVAYAHRWAYDRNPAFYAYDEIGGDCTNFASQCLYAGGARMNDTPDFGWYYLNANNKAPAWTGVTYLYRFLTRPQSSVGPVAMETTINVMEPGDLIQLSFDGMSFQHTTVVVNAESPQTPEDILVAAHNYDADHRPLSSYDYQLVRFLHITGINP